MLNLYDTEAVKAFIFNILVENQELKQQAANSQASSDMWFKDYQAQKERAEKAEAKVVELSNIPIINSLQSTEDLINKLIAAVHSAGFDVEIGCSDGWLCEVFIGNEPKEHYKNDPIIDYESGWPCVFRHKAECFINIYQAVFKWLDGRSMQGDEKK